MKKNALKYAWLGLGIIFILIVIIVGATSKTNSNDGKCDICGKTKKYDLYGEEYCEKHVGDAIDHYLK